MLFVNMIVSQVLIFLNLSAWQFCHDVLRVNFAFTCKCR